jgi:hypothetical protein
MMSDWCKKGVSMMFNCCLISERIVLAKHLFAWGMRYVWSHPLRVFLGTEKLQDRPAQRTTAAAYDTPGVRNGGAYKKPGSQRQIIWTARPGLITSVRYKHQHRHITISLAG